MTTLDRPRFPPPCGPLSEQAVRLLSVLRSVARGPENATPDKRLAELCQVAPRIVVDLAGELLDAGYIVIASCKPPMGRFLLEPGDDMAPARAYLASLRRRGIRVLRRRRRLASAIEQAEQSRAVRDDGQRALPLEIAP